MLKDTITIEKGITSPIDLRKTLFSMRFKLVLPSILCLIVYLFLIYMNFFVWEYEWVLCIIVTVIPLFGNIISDLKPNCIYKFKIESGYVKLFLVNTLGKKRSLSISVDQINEFECQNKGFWSRHGIVWFHFVERVEEYYFISDGLGEELANNINVGENKTN